MSNTEKHPKSPLGSIVPSAEDWAKAREGAKNVKLVLHHLDAADDKHGKMDGKIHVGAALKYIHEHVAGATAATRRVYQEFTRIMLEEISHTGRDTIARQSDAAIDAGIPDAAAFSAIVLEARQHEFGAPNTPPRAAKPKTIA